MRIMRFTFIAVIVGAITLTSVAQNLNTSTDKASSSIVGTWQLVGADKQEVDLTLFWRFYPDGTWAEWPAGAGGHTDSSSTGVQRARYLFLGTYLVLRPGVDRPTKSTLGTEESLPVEISGDTLTVVKTDKFGGLHHVSYRRLTPDLEPTNGIMPHGQSRHATDYVLDLMVQGRLPGYSNPNGDASGILLDQERLKSDSKYETYPVTETCRVTVNGDPTVYHYTLFRASKTSNWQLQRAWQIDSQGHILHEFGVQTNSSGLLIR